MRRSGSERGAILLQVSFLLLVLMGMASVVVDMGMARATQVFMQAGADAASLEGLRYRDVVLEDAAASDLERREAAARAAALAFDEDLDLDTVQNDVGSEYRLGAGPTFTTGVGGVADPAGGLLVPGDPHLPLLQLNVDENAGYGDLVAGEYRETDPDDEGNANWHQEDASYARFDFVPAAAAEAAGAPAFLARLRRTNDTVLDRVPGVSSAGPTVPFLFGLGSGVLSTDDPAVYDPRRDGVTVRATAIADARPAVAVGVGTPSVNGLLSLGNDVADPSLARVLVLEDSSWQELVTAPEFQIQVSAAGTVTGAPGGPTPDVQALARPAGSWLQVGDGALVGPSQLPVDLASPGELEGLGYVALYSGDRLTGFAAVLVDEAFGGVVPGEPATITLFGEALPGIVAPENASAAPALLDLPGPALQSTLSALSATAQARELLLAPVLVR